MACYIFGAGSYYGLRSKPDVSDYVIAADGGWRWCRSAGLTPDLLLGDFDSLGEVPAFDHILRVPVEKDDTDMMLAIKKGLERGCRESTSTRNGRTAQRPHRRELSGAAVSCAARRARLALRKRRDLHRRLREREITFPARADGILSVFCLGELAAGVTIRGAHYSVENAVLTPDFPLGCSNHFIGRPITVSVERGDLLLGLHEVEE